MEFIGFFISLLALVYLYYQQYSAATRRRQQRREAGVLDEEAEDDPLRSLMEEMRRREEPRDQRRVLPPPPPRKVKHGRKQAKPSLAAYHLESDLETRKIKSRLQNRHLQPSVAKRPEGSVIDAISLEGKLASSPSKAMDAVERLAHRRDLLIYQEIIGPPRSLRPFE